MDQHITAVQGKLGVKSIHSSVVLGIELQVNIWRFLEESFQLKHRQNGQGRMEWKVPPSPSSRPASGTTLVLPEDLTGGNHGTLQG